MKAMLHPRGSDFKTVEVFSCPEGVGFRLLSGDVLRLTPDEWRDLQRDVDRFVELGALTRASGESH